ncbi:MAG: hypothetical protein HQL87_15510 [Magnetococcales bacterium]|nr:hypothetical protein [Magnetococcales bacterium]
MNAPIAHCQVAVRSDQQAEPFVLVADHAPGSLPVQVYPLQIDAWSQQPGIYEAYLPLALRLKAWGLRRIRLYCSSRSDNEVRLVVGGGGYRRLGRMGETRIETVTWVQTQTQSLRFFYDQPAVTILESTRFFDNNGQETTQPVYLPESGAFYHAQPVTGALVVAYQPGYLLYEIEYDTGESAMSAAEFQAVKLAWLAGNIHDATIPPVRVMAISRQQATQVTFPRSFWPACSSARLLFRDTEADQTCADSNGPESYQYVESKRETKAERIYSHNDPNTYVDILRTVAIAFELKPVNGGVCADAAASGQSATLNLRFQNPGTPA